MSVVVGVEEQQVTQVQVVMVHHGQLLKSQLLQEQEVGVGVEHLREQLVLRDTYL
jgi:hypothetical protein